MVKDREAWHAVVHGVAKSRTWLSNWVTKLEGIFYQTGFGLQLHHWLSLGLQSASPHCSFYTHQPIYSHKPVPYNKSPSLHAHILLVLFLWETQTNTDFGTMKWHTTQTLCKNVEGLWHWDCKDQESFKAHNRKNPDCLEETIGRRNMDINGDFSADSRGNRKESNSY